MISISGQPRMRRAKGVLQTILLSAGLTALTGCEILSPHAGCGNARWTHLGPDGVHVLSLAQTPHGVWAGTMEDGVLHYGGERDWKPLGLNGAPVYSLLPVEERVLAGRDSGEPLFATEDGGRTWVPSWGELNRSVLRMAADPDNPQRIIRTYFIAPHAESLDGGRTWRRLPTKETLSTTYGMVVLSGDRIISAGVGSFSNAVISYYEQEQIQAFSPVPWPGGGIFGNLVQDPADPETIFAGERSALYVSHNGGRDWDTVLRDEWEGVPYGMAFDRGNLYIATLVLEGGGPGSPLTSRPGLYQYRPGGSICRLNVPRAASGAVTMLRTGRGQFLVGTRGSGVWRVQVW